MRKIISLLIPFFLMINFIIAQSLEFNDDEGNHLMLINDEGATGSVLTDKIGIGTTNPLSKLSVGGDGDLTHTIFGLSLYDTGNGVYGEASNTGNFINNGGKFISRGQDGNGIYARAYGSNGWGVLGIASGDGHGVYGRAEGSGNGVSGIANNDGHGVVAIANGNGKGLHAESYGSTEAIFGKAYDTGNNYNHGGYFESLGQQGNGIFSKANGPYGNGVFAEANGENGVGVFGIAKGANGTGVRGISEATSQYQVGVDGFSSGPDGFGVHGSASDANGVGVKGWTDGANAISIMGDANGLDGIGVFGIGNGTNGRGIVGEAPANGTAFAGWFNGNVHVTGNITYDGTMNQSGSSIVMNHPSDGNKNIVHAGVSSSEMKNIYDGRVVTNSGGEAIVNLPEWFEALNKDFRYQLTVIGDFAQAIISDELSDNQFAIKTNKPNVKVSWQITGIRNDEYANENKIEVERPKQSFATNRIKPSLVYERMKEERARLAKRLEEQELAMQQISERNKQRSSEQKSKIEEMKSKMNKQNSVRSSSAANAVNTRKSKNSNLNK